MVKTIQVSDEFHSYLASHGRFQERMEAILIRLLGDKFRISSGDRVTKMYDGKDVDSKKYKRSQKTGEKRR